MSRRAAQFAFVILLASGLVGCKRDAPDRGNRKDPAQGPSEQFLSLMNAGKNHLDQGDATNALLTYRKAEAIAPHDVDVNLNLANAHLASGAAAEAIREADEVLKLEPNSAAAYFVKGSAYLRLSNPEEALKALENTRKIDPGQAATFFQLGMARMGLKQWEEAIVAFREGLRLDPNRLHAAVHFQLSQALLRAGRQEEATQEIQRHQVSLEGGGPAASATTFERSKFTQARVPFRLDQPDRSGIQMRFVDATREALAVADKFSGPIGVINGNHKGWTSLFVTEPGAGFRTLWNSNGIFHPHPEALPGIPGANYHRVLVGDLQNDRFDDVVVLGDKGGHLFQFATNGRVRDVSAQSGLSSPAKDGLLMDLDFAGKLDLVAVGALSNDLRIFRQFGPLFFKEITSTSGIPVSLRDAESVSMVDWNRDENMDLVVSRRAGPPLLLEKLRGGRLVPREPTNWVAGTAFVTADFDNDLRPDLAIVSGGKIHLCFNSGERTEIAIPAGVTFRKIAAVDHDNDGWMDLWALGGKVRAWRNLGLSGFEDQTDRLGLAALEGQVSEMHWADFDRDCDPDVVMVLATGGLRYLRNDGGNANAQVKVQMIGSRSNASGIGCKIEIETGGLRLIRTVHSLPVEIGVGKHQKLDSFLVHWFNWPQGSAELGFNCSEPIFALELTIQEGSCPYVYAWDGKGFRFVTDILGAAPLGLPVAPGRHIEADPEEFVWIGNEESFPARDGFHPVQITEELREVLYLDEAKLVVVDREPGTEVHSTDKLLPGKPFPKGEIVTLHNEHPLQAAAMVNGGSVIEALRVVDGHRVSPPRLRVPQLRGLAEPHGLILDFGPLDAGKPLVLVMNGWLRFGGGMANIAASHDPALPFPFPSLEAETFPGVWKPVDVTVGAPAGKTKTILVDLAGKLNPGTRRLRLTQAFEIHWDRIALLEKKPNATTRITLLPPAKAHLHFRGFSALQELPPNWPLTPDYARVSPNFYWTITPGGWCTRYGDVSELIASRDEGLALLNGGDELTLEFAARALPQKPNGTVREFFLYVDGWDKDSDFHVTTGTEVQPLPFHGMDDQMYGSEKRPAFASDALHRKYNTRWVEGRVLKQSARR